eukprot:CAMPEP_0206506590 /NCGR_PEP_ID=MMETSP0324_2-20121206/56855_1 /ASSEMBLY_ACC=CAM_ASM_000836 /TAXON_ID=2866 /ORGANISM="Crypthecodinium cohnii, Strain Seligo" /LENGTH=42 /DNA_ID= /DNA_START= /DNA_END= /DNA_ORIENTATION=
MSDAKLDRDREGTCGIHQVAYVKAWSCETGLTEPQQGRGKRE